MNLIGRNLDNAVKSLNLPDTIISLLRLTRGKATQEVQHKEFFFWYDALKTLGRFRTLGLKSWFGLLTIDHLVV